MGVQNRVEEILMEDCGCELDNFPSVDEDETFLVIWIENQKTYGKLGELVEAGHEMFFDSAVFERFQNIGQK